jgi:hypothetical protein
VNIRSSEYCATHHGVPAHLPKPIRTDKLKFDATAESDGRNMHAVTFTLVSPMYCTRKISTRRTVLVPFWAVRFQYDIVPLATRPNSKSYSTPLGFVQVIPPGLRRR